MATVIPAVGPVRELRPGRGASFQLEELQAAVGGYIEALYLPEAVMFVDEDGKSKGKPFNTRATVLAGSLGKLRAGDVIVGDAIVCSVAEAGEPDVTYGFRVMSPDGVPIAPTDYATRELAEAACAEWCGRFVAQGYYASTSGPIALSELPMRCTIVAVEEEDDDDDDVDAS